MLGPLSYVFGSFSLVTSVSSAVAFLDVLRSFLFYPHDRPPAAMTVTVADPLFAFNQLTLLAAVGFAGGLYLFVRGFRMLARKRLLINTPTSKIRSASMGLVEVNGMAAGPYTLPAPISGAPCFLYRTTAWQKSDESKSGEWKKVAEETLHVPFFLDDGTGRLLIEPMGADLDLHRDFVQNFSDTIFSPHATQPVLSFLARHGVEPSNKIRIEECSIHPNTPLFIVGTLAENPGIEVRPPAPSNARQAGSFGTGVTRSRTPPPPEIVRLSPSVPMGDMTQQSKIAAALDKAGITSQVAWQAAGVPREMGNGTQVSEMSVHTDSGRDSTAVDSSFDLRPPVVLMKGANNPAFLISWRSQQEIVGSMGWQCSVMIWGGSAMTLLGVYVVLQQLGLL